MRGCSGQRQQRAGVRDAVCTPAQRPRRPSRTALLVAASRKKLRRMYKEDIDTSVPAPSFDYVGALTRRRRDPSTCPPLFLAPMENLADRHFRISIATTVGGFDEACTEFIRVPTTTSHVAATVRGVTAVYNARELGPCTPLGAQIMGSGPETLAATAAHLTGPLEAPRVDLNCGCPANTVTGKGAGSSLLRTPDALHDNVRAIVQAVGPGVCVSVKMRSGYDDTALFDDNLLAAQEAGASFVTVHPRTKRQGYNGRADWSFIARARSLLSIPVIGNGDVVSVAAARQLLSETGCDGVMIGRGAVADPLLFHRIRMSFMPEQLPWPYDEPEVICSFLEAFGELTFGWCVEHVTEHERLGRLKKITKYLFSTQPGLWEACGPLLRLQPGHVSSPELLELLCREVRRHWAAEGPTQHMLINHQTKAAVPAQLLSDVRPLDGGGTGTSSSTAADSLVASSSAAHTTRTAC